jgi:hypothetical protein
MMSEKLTDIGKSLGADPATVKLCAALIEFRSYGISSSSVSPVARALRDAAQSLSELLIAPPPPSEETPDER